MIINAIMEYICEPQIAGTSLPVWLSVQSQPMHGPARGVKQVSPPTMSQCLKSHLFAWPWPSLSPIKFFRPLASNRWLVFPQSLHTTMESQLPTTVLIFIHKQCFSPL